MASLAVIRIPSPQGPIVRCQGSLTLTNAESLRRDLALLIAGRHGSLIVNINEIRHLDPHGALALVEASQEMSRSGGRLIVVAGREPAAGLMNTLGIDRELAVCTSEDAALTLVNGTGQKLSF